MAIVPGEVSINQEVLNVPETINWSFSVGPSMGRDSPGQTPYQDDPP